MQYRDVEAFERDPDPIVADAEAGETIMLTRDGMPVVRLEPIDQSVIAIDG